MTARAPFPFPANRHAEQVRHAARFRALNDRTLTEEGADDLWTLVWLMNDLPSDISAESRTALLYEIGRTE